MSIAAVINRFARSFLYVWVRSSSIPEQPATLNIDPEKPVVYVLYQRSWSNLLVFSHEAAKLGLPSPFSWINTPSLRRWHSVYTVASKVPFKSWLTDTPKRSPLLFALLDHLDEFSTHDIQLVPVTLFWGRPVAKQKHWLTMLFSDSWQIASRTRKLFTILFHGRQVLVTLSQPISLRQLLDDGVSREEQTDRIQEALSRRLVEMKTATLGPDISHRNTMIREIIQSEPVQREITARSDERKISHYKSSLYARKYLRESVADCTTITIQVMQRLLTWFWNRFYSGIQVNQQNDLHQLALNHEIVYVPCHRSHIDYLLLSYLIYREGLSLPYIAAGNNLNMPVIGKILRGGGAFFIRRSFKGNTLYSAALAEYVSRLLARGLSLEYFVEGGRSRTGRLLKPKYGMLSMTIRGYLRYRERPVAFVPVYIGYEKLIESKAYLAELSGEDKKSETFFGSMTSIFRLRGNYGSVTTNFGEPILLEDVLDNCNEDWRTTELGNVDKPSWLTESVAEAARQVMDNINSCADVNPTNLIASILLSTSKRTMDERELSQMIILYIQLVRKTAYSDRVTHTEIDPANQIRHLELLKLVRRRQHELGDIIYLDEKQSVALTYYRNNTLHLFALPSLIACCFLNMRSQTTDQIIALVRLAYPFLRSELFLRWSDDELESVVRSTLDIISDLGLLEKNEQLDVYSRPGSGVAAYNQLSLLARVISPILEVYYLIVVMMTSQRESGLARSDLEDKSVLMAQRIAMMNEFDSPDYSDRKLISNFIDQLIDGDYLRGNDEDTLELGDAFDRADKQARLLLGREIRTQILQLLRPS